MKIIFYMYALIPLVLTSSHVDRNPQNYNETATTGNLKACEKIETQVKLSHKDSLKIIVDKYYALNMIVFQKGSTVEDIDAIFDLFSDDFVYIHPKYGGTYTRKELYDGYIRNQRNGGYDGSVTDIHVDNMIIGINAVVVEKRFINGSEEGEAQMTLFEIDHGRISRIYEYW